MEKRFPFPLNVICAYEEEDIVQLDNLELKSLLEHHGVFHKDSIKELVYPLRNSHIILLYDNQQDLTDSYITYINEGLARGQLCVFASVLLQNNDFLRNISPKIINFEQNVQNKNLVLVDMANYYIQAMMDNLHEFDKFKNNLIENVKNDKNRNNKHFDLLVTAVTFFSKTNTLKNALT
jgi:hypothetical protein